jgi:hypothetical protein
MSYGGGIPPGTPKGVLIADAGSRGLSRVLDEHDRWAAEIERRIAARGTRRRFIIDMGDAEFEAFEREHPDWREAL